MSSTRMKNPCCFQTSHASLVVLLVAILCISKANASSCFVPDCINNKCNYTNPPSAATTKNTYNTYYNEYITGSTASPPTYNSFGDYCSSNGGGGADTVQGKHWTQTMQSRVEDKPGQSAGQAITQVQVAFQIDDIVDIDTKGKTLQLNVREHIMWKDAQLACSSLTDYYVRDGDTCDWLPTTVQAAQASNAPCYLHPPAVTPQAWGMFMADKKAMGEPIICSYEMSADLQINTFKSQYWSPELIARKVVDKGVVNNEAITVLPYNKEGEPYILHERQYRVEVKTPFVLDAYPFDSQAIDIIWDPTATDTYPRIQYVDNIYNEEVRIKDPQTDLYVNGINLTTSVLNSAIIGTTVSGFTINNIVASTFQWSDDEHIGSEKLTYQSYKLTLYITREPGSVFYSYGITGIIVWFCSWTMFFIATGNPPALAGVVVAQIVLIMITNNLSSQIIDELPAGTSTVFMEAYLYSFMLVQILQLCAHCLRQHLVTDKLPNKLRFYTIFNRYVFPALALIGETVVLWTYDNNGEALGGDGWRVSLLLVTILYCLFACWVIFRIRYLWDSSEVLKEHTNGMHMMIQNDFASMKKRKDATQDHDAPEPTVEVNEHKNPVQEADKAPAHLTLSV